MGAGTIEFLYDPQTEQAAFIEMNTRLQVEHPITEMITGFDLVREQLRIASGESLGYDQGEITFSGHALEFRINAEDPDNNFMPSPGTITDLNVAGGPGVRADFGFIAGKVVAPFYDSLLGKIIVWGRDRDHAIAGAQRVLAETGVGGVKSALVLARRLVALEDFRATAHHTKYIESTPGLLEGNP